MAWNVKLGGKTVNFDDLPPSVFDDLAAKEEDVSWWSVYSLPGGNSARLYRVIVACAEFAQVDPPDEPTDMRAARQLLDLLEVGPDLSEASVVDGFPPTPAVPESGSTSGALGDSDGQEQSLEPSQSASS